MYGVMQGRDHGIRYHTLHDNKYIRYFTGHTERVTGLCLCPSTDLFISSSEVSKARSSLQVSCLSVGLHPMHGNLLFSQRDMAAAAPDGVAQHNSIRANWHSAEIVSGKRWTSSIQPVHQGMRGAGMQDCAVRMWDLRSMSCEGLLETPAKSAVAFDQQVDRRPAWIG